MKNKVIAVLLLCALITTGAGCKKKKKPEEVSPTPTQEMTQTEKPTGDAAETPDPDGKVEQEEEAGHEGEVRSILTGEWVKKETANNRPYAIMINNIINANAGQCGTSEASILYEALAEGGITRLMGIFEDVYDQDGNPIKRIGSTRSARHYYVSFADEYDAIYVHFGETKYATKKIKNLGIDNLSGLTGIGNTVFFRDKSIRAPHNAFASGEGLLKGTKSKKYRTTYKDGYEGQHFKFYNEDTDLDSTNQVKKLTLKYSSFKPYFVYDEKEKVYKRFQHGGEHIDHNTGKQLAFKNIIVQFVHEYDIDKKHYQTMDITNNKGNGFYISNGVYVPITWEKDESKKKMNYYDQTGEVLKINPGKTFISIFPDNRKNDVVFE